MFSKHHLLLGMALVGLGCQIALAAEINISMPVRSATEDQVKSMPGLNYELKFKHYSGYLEADDHNNRFWHYWFVESQSRPDQDPLVLWLNGGPGCSSLLGLLTELGPFSVKDDNLVDNPYAWNKNANVIFMESPAGVGFSYAVDGNITADDDTTAHQNWVALRSFMRKFPQFKDRPLYLTGESYGGVYLPTLAVLVDQDPSLNLKGVAIGNGYLDAKKLAESLVFFSYYHGLVGSSTWRGIGKHCCDGHEPSRQLCHLLSPKRSHQCTKFVFEASDAILKSGLNPYNLYDRCAQPTELGFLKSSNQVGREHFDKSLMLQAFQFGKGNPSKIFSSFRSNASHLFQLDQSVRADPPCTDDSVTINYLNRLDVQQALHIPRGLAPFTTCFDGIQYTMIYPGLDGGLAPQVKKLIESPRKLTLLVYNGDTDMMCNFFGDEWFVDDLNRKVLADYEPWHVNGQVAGFVKHFEGITYMTVKGSGHMVPTDRPQEALQMFETFLFGHKRGINY